MSCSSEQELCDDILARCNSSTRDADPYGQACQGKPVAALLAQLGTLQLLLGEDGASAKMQLPLACKDTLAEWLRRWPAKSMGSPRMGSNPMGVAFQ